ncbi:MAG: hypothetical protein ACLPLR_04450 [Terriglobales bacterium]
MKKTLFLLCLLCLLCTTAAFGQRIASVSSEPQSYQFPTHEAHASYTPMTQEKSVLGGGNYTTAQGERPASDFPQAEQVSLGAYAREIREQHAQLKKARVVWVNQ